MRFTFVKNCILCPGPPASLYHDHHIDNSEISRNWQFFQSLVWNLRSIPVLVFTALCTWMPQFWRSETLHFNEYDHHGVFILIWSLYCERRRAMNTCAPGGRRGSLEETSIQLFVSSLKWVSHSLIWESVCSQCLFFVVNTDKEYDCDSHSHW